MNAYLLLPIIQTLFCLVLIAVVLKGRFGSFIHRLFALYLLSLATWGFVIFGMRASPDIEYAYLWEKWLVPLGPLMAVLSYHFSVRYSAAKIQSSLLPFLYLICLAFVPLAATGLVFSGMQIKPYGYAPVFGPVAPVFILFVYVLSVMALFNFVRMWRTSDYAEQRNRAAYISLGKIASLIGGFFDILPILGLPLYPGVIFGNIIFCLLTTVAIVKYNLLDIRVVLRKSVVYILASTLIALPLIGIFLVVTILFADRKPPLWVYLVLVLVLAIGMSTLWQKVQRRVDRILYRDRYNYLKALETFSRETQSLTDSIQLGSTMVKLITGAVRASSAYLLQPVHRTRDFAILDSAGVNAPTTDIYLKRQSPIVKWLERFPYMLSFDDIDIIPQLQGITSREKKALQQVGAELFMPLKARTGRLSGLLILGPKISEERYTVEDKQLIYAISSQVATKLDNVHLYNESQQEVAERKRAEEALRRNEEHFRSIIENALDAIFILDREGAIQYASPSVQWILGYEPGEVIGKNIFDFIHPDDLTNTVKTFIYTFQVPDYITSLEFRTQCKDSSWRNIEVTGKNLLDNPAVAGVVVNFRDITERKQAKEREEELQQELNLSRRLASIGELAAGVAHELNNPLTGILGYSQRLLRKSTDEKMRQDLGKIYEGAQRAANVVENLRTFARRREAMKEHFNINDILEKTTEMRIYELETSNIKVVKEFDTILPPVMVDFQQIQQVFLNIILNAEQAMAEANQGGEIIIRASKIKNYIRVSITDDGPGIPDEYLDKLFDPFFTTRGDKGGTGLGLSICHGIITEHDGRIYAKSKPGKGSTFFVELPITTEKINECNDVTK